MPIYEKRTYDVTVGKMAELSGHYETAGWDAIAAGGFDAYLVGYFMSDTGPLHQLVHIWRFDDDADRRRSGNDCSPTTTSWRSRPRSVR